MGFRLAPIALDDLRPSDTVYVCGLSGPPGRRCGLAAQGRRNGAEKGRGAMASHGAWPPRRYAGVFRLLGSGWRLVADGRPAAERVCLPTRQALLAGALRHATPRGATLR